jgi:hypothetical protein
MKKLLSSGEKLADTSYHFFSHLLLLRRGTIFALIVLTGIGSYAIRETGAYETGITGQTQKTTNEGCYCHCSSASSGTTVTLASSSGSSPLTTSPNTTYDFTITVASTSEGSNAEGGCDIATYSGNGLTAGSGLYASGGELTHNSPKSFDGNGNCTWDFTYTSGSTTGWDTIYATGNAVNGDGSDDNGDCDDNWNWAPKFIIHNVVPPVRMTLSRTSISMGEVRVGNREADSLKLTSDGEDAITISSSGMKGGAPFSSYPSTSNRTIDPGSTEIDSIIFMPSSRGSFSDSLIFNTNSDTVPEQRMGVAVSGQGIQAIFNATNGTSIAFGNLRADQTVQQTFSFSNTGDDTLFLQNPSISGAGFSIATEPSTLTFPPNQSGSVVVQFAPTAAQSYSGSLTFTASNGVKAPTVSLSGTGILPEIQVASSDNLGSTKVGQTLNGTVTFKNIGTDTLHVSNASLTQLSTLFTLGAYDQTVLPNASGMVDISYTPTAEETDDAALHFSTDDPTDSAVSIAISGTGTLPHMMIAESGDTINLGQIRVNSSGTANIGITNNGGADLAITSVTAGPSPFGVDASPTVVSAGTTSDVTVGFAPTITGVFTGTLIVNGNAPSNPSDTVYLSGSGINSVLSINPGSVDFGQVPILSTMMDTIILSDSGQANVTIYSIQLSPQSGAFAIVGTTPSEVVAGGSAVIVLSFDPDTDINYSGTLTLTTDDANAPTRTINLTGLGIKDPFTVSPSQVNFSQVPILTTVTDTITLSNSGTSSVTISYVQLSPASGAFAIVGSSPSQVSAGGTTTVIVSFHPDTAGSYSGSLTLTTSDASIPIRTISLSGTGIKGTLSISPSKVNFGTIVIGRDSTIRVNLRNIGQAGVTINAIGLVGASPSEFSYGTFPTPVTIGANDSSFINASFTPYAAQNYQDTIRLAFEDGSSLNIVLTGTGSNGAGVVQDNVAPIPFAISLSPNPAENAVTVHATLLQTGETLLELFDAVGHPVLSMPLGMLAQGEHDFVLPIEDLASGSYFVRVSNADGSADAALIVEKK